MTLDDPELIAYLHGWSTLAAEEFYRGIPRALEHLGEELLDSHVRVPFTELEHPWAFVRALFECSGSLIVGSHTTLRVPEPLVAPLTQFIGLPFVRTQDREGIFLTFEGDNGLDLLGHLYDQKPQVYDPRSRNNYLRWAARRYSTAQDPYPVFYWKRLRPDAVPPTKTRVSDAGYDVTILGPKGDQPQDSSVRLYHTGIAVACSPGWYFDLAPRSSLSKTGYMLANSFGVIDPTYRGELLVALIRVLPDAPALEFPARLVQLVPRVCVHGPMVELEELDTTARGSGGFGSTGQ